MAYLGNTPSQQAFAPAVDYFNGNASTVAFTLSRPVASVAQVKVTIENVPQNPSSAFTVSGSTITFTSAPPSGTSNIYVTYTSPITTVIAPGQGTVNTTQLGSSLLVPIASGGTGSASTTYCSLTANVTGILPSANGGTGVTTSTGSGDNVLGTSPTLVTPALGTPSALVGTNISGTSNSFVAGLAVNQTWALVTRTSGTTYTNTYGKPISVNASMTHTYAYDTVSITVAGIVVASAISRFNESNFLQANVPIGTTYSFTYSYSASIAELK